MKKLRNFKCSDCERIEEKFAEDDVLVSECICGGSATRTISAPGYFGNSTGRSPAATTRRK